MISVAVSGFILALAEGVFIAFVVLVSGFIPLALAAGVFIAFMVLVSGVIPMALAARVFIAFTVLASASSAGHPQDIQATLFQPKQRSYELGFLEKINMVYTWLGPITVG